MPISRKHFIVINNTKNTLSKGVPVPPTGFVFLLDFDGAYLTDVDGAYLLEVA